MKLSFSAFLFISLMAVPDPASAKVYLCSADTFCWSHNYKVPAGCHSSQQSWTVTTGGKDAYVDDGQTKNRLKQARPFFLRIGWYQGGDTRRNGNVELKLLLEGDDVPFSLSQMVPRRAQTELWQYRGHCQNIDR